MLDAAQIDTAKLDALGEVELRELAAKLPTVKVCCQASPEAPRSRVVATVSSGLARDCVAAKAAMPSATAARSFSASNSPCASRSVTATSGAGSAPGSAGLALKSRAGDATSVRSDCSATITAASACATAACAAATAPSA